MDTAKFTLLSAREGTARSTLVFVSHKDANRNSEIYNELKQNGVYVAARAGKLRFSPHLYNTDPDVDRALSILHAA